jgi:hypothetical protein
MLCLLKPCLKKKGHVLFLLVGFSFGLCIEVLDSYGENNSSLMSLFLCGVIATNSVFHFLSVE